LRSAADNSSTYKFVLPSKLTFLPISASLDRNSTPPCLLLGESTSPGEDSIFAKFPFNDTTNLLASNSGSRNKGLTTAVWAYENNVNNAEGIVFARNSYWIMSNDGDDVGGDVFRWNPGSWADEFNGILPPGVQGVSYKPEGDELWMLGSVTGKRYVMALSASMKNNTGTNTSGSDSDGQSQGNDDGNSSNVEPSGSAIPATPEDKKYLSPGAKAGIVLGVLAGIGGLLAGVLVLLKRRKRAAAASTGYIGATTENGWYMKPELSDEHQRKSELAEKTEAVELPLSPVREEMHA
jgi:hypothetical protein